MDDDSILSELQAEAAKDHIDVIWTDGLHPATPPTVSVKRRRIIMNLKWPNKNELTFQLGHEMSHILNDDSEGRWLYYNNRYTKSDIENNANKGAIDLIMPYYMVDRDFTTANPTQFVETFEVPNYLTDVVGEKMYDYLVSRHYE